MEYATEYQVDDIAMMSFSQRSGGSMYRGGMKLIVESDDSSMRDVRVVANRPPPLMQATVLCGALTKEAQSQSIVTVITLFGQIVMASLQDFAFAVGDGG
jgi:hypothetical protein